MKKIILLICIAIMLLSFIACGNKAKAERIKMGEAHYKMALSYFSENNITSALKEFLMAYEFDPENYEINNMLGMTYFMKNDLLNAEKHLKEAIRLNKNNPEACNNLGTVYTEMKRYDDAIAQFEAAINNILYATPEKAYTNMGWAYYQKGDLIQAKKAYEKSIEIEPRLAVTYHKFGILYFDSGKYDDAINQYKDAIKFCPTCVDPWYNLGSTYLKTSNNEKAQEAFNKVIEIAPNTQKAKDAKGYLELLK